MNHRTYEFGRYSTKFGCGIIKVAKENIPLLICLSEKECVEGGYDIHVRIRFLKNTKNRYRYPSGGEGQLAA